MLSWPDLLVVALAALGALLGAARGGVAQVLSLTGFACGWIVGSRLGPYLLPNGSDSPWLPVVGLVIAVVAGIGAQAIAGVAGRRARTRLHRHRIGALLDATGGGLVGALLGVTLAWVFAVVALDEPGLGFRQAVGSSQLMPRMVAAVPPRTLLLTVESLDPMPAFPTLPGLTLAAPDRAILVQPAVRDAAASVVKIEGSSCGRGLEGTGWVAGRDLIVTNVHVVAGRRSSIVTTPSGRTLRADVVALNPHDDVAVLFAPGLDLPSLRLGPPANGTAAVLGFPDGGPLTFAAARIGSPAEVLTRDAYLRQTVRAILPLRADVRHGDSGGPLVDATGRVVGMIFGAAAGGGGGGFAVPRQQIADTLDGPLRPLEAVGACP